MAPRVPSPVRILALHPAAVTLTGLVLGSLAAPAGAQCELARFAATDGAAADAFGSFVALSGNRAVVGAPNDDEGGQDTGAAFVFEESGGVWTQTAKLRASDRAAFDRFGSSVAIDGDRIVVGSPQDDDGGFDSGAAYVFEHDGSGWPQVAKLTAFDTFFGDFYGVNVAVDGNRVVVGACQVTQFDVFGTGNGKVYVYTGGGAAWALEQQLTAADADPGDRFGAGVDYDGARILVGAENDDQGGTDAGAGYVFELAAGTWSEKQKLLPSDAGAGALAGVSVSIDGDRALLGAPLHQTGGTRPGAGYLFEYDGSTWSEAAKLLAAAAVTEDRAGLTVEVVGGLALVGAYAQTSLTPGRVYAWTRDGAGTWAEGPTLTPAAGVVGDAFGYGVASDGSRVIVGARNEGGAGAAYEFLWSPATVAFRNAGANPASLSVDVVAALGAAPTLSVDLAGTSGHAFAGVVAYAGTLSLPLGGGQVVLVDVTDPSGELFGLGLSSGPVATWTLAVPTDVSLCGLGVSVQAVHVGGVQPFALSNALDFVVGG